MSTIGSGPVQAEYLEKMRALAEGIDEIFNGEGTPKAERTTGFILLVFPFDQANKAPGEHRCNYISNANRDDVKVLLKEQLAYFEGQSDKHTGGRA